MKQLALFLLVLAFDLLGGLLFLAALLLTAAFEAARDLAHSSHFIL